MDHGSSPISSPGSSCLPSSPVICDVELMLEIEKLAKGLLQKLRHTEVGTCITLVVTALDKEHFETILNEIWEMVEIYNKCLQIPPPGIMKYVYATVE